MAKKPTALAGISLATVSDDGQAIIIEFVDQSGEKHLFGIPPEAAIEIVQRLIGAASHPAISMGHPKRAVVLEGAQVVVNDEQGTVGIQMFLDEKIGLPFAMTPDQADSLSSGLAAASASVRPRKGEH